MNVLQPFVLVIAEYFGRILFSVALVLSAGFAVG